MNLIKLEDLNAVPLEEVVRKLERKYGKMAFDNEINEIGEELNPFEIEYNLVNNVVPKPEEFDEFSRRNTYFMRPRYALEGCTINFFFGLISRKTITYEETISQTDIS